ncbi:hypothetical protein FQN54_003382 [Arachnomyces sp. PD_36]|nr:hypothetical protein FQN54_003382 [Arachnomyces sp. PD_36]
MSSERQTSPARDEIFYWGSLGRDSEHSIASMDVSEAPHRSDTEPDNCAASDTDSTTAQPASPNRLQDFAPPSDDGQNTTMNGDGMSDDQQSSPPPLTSGTTDSESEGASITDYPDQQQSGEHNRHHDDMLCPVLRFLRDAGPWTPDGLVAS